MMDFAAARRTMVENQLRTYDILDYNTLDVMGSLPREMFLPAERQSMAYLDLSVSLGANRALMCPMVFGRLLQALEVKKTDRVLDVAGGTGYSACALGKLAASVVALDEDEAQLAITRANFAASGLTNAETVQGNITQGHPKSAPYDVIFVNGAVETEPSALLSQLSEGGRLGVILGLGRSGRALIYHRSGKNFTATRIIDAAAEPLMAFAKPAEFRF